MISLIKSMGKMEQMDEMFHENCSVFLIMGYEFRAKTLPFSHILFLEPLKLHHIPMGLLSNSYGFLSLETCPDNCYCATLTEKLLCRNRTDYGTVVSLDFVS
jgi:hypothetical protein